MLRRSNPGTAPFLSVAFCAPLSFGFRYAPGARSRGPCSPAWPRCRRLWRLVPAEVSRSSCQAAQPTVPILSFLFPSGLSRAGVAAELVAGVRWFPNLLGSATESVKVVLSARVCRVSRIETRRQCSTCGSSRSTPGSALIAASQRDTAVGWRGSPTGESGPVRQENDGREGQASQRPDGSSRPAFD